jgi:hypothetical protein
VKGLALHCTVQMRPRALRITFAHLLIGPLRNRVGQELGVDAGGFA